MATKYIRAHQNKFEGVYYYESKTKVFEGKPDRCFVYTYKIAGRKIWEKVGWRSKGITDKIADSERTKRLQEIHLGAPVKTAAQRKEEALKKNRRIDEIASIYFETNKSNLKGYKTDKNRYDKHIKPMFGKRRVSDLTQLDMSDLRNSMAGKADATIWNALEMVRRIINFGAKSELCPALSFTIEMPTRDNERVEYLNPEEVKRFFTVMEDWPNQEACRMLKLAYFTAMRKGEIFKLEDCDLDFQFNLIRLRNPKGKKSKSIPMSPVARKLIEQQQTWRDEKFPDSTYLFPGKLGTQRTECSAVDSIKKAAELPTDFRIFHGLRHHFAVTLANSGEYQLDMIAELMTHESTIMTKRYGQFLPTTIQAASDKAAKLLSSIEA